MAATETVLPGQPLPQKYTLAPQPQPGVGCYVHGDRILASIVGIPRREGAVSVPFDTVHDTYER